MNSWQSLSLLNTETSLTRKAVGLGPLLPARRHVPHYPCYVFIPESRLRITFITSRRPRAKPRVIPPHVGGLTISGRSEYGAPGGESCCRAGNHYLSLLHRPLSALCYLPRAQPESRPGPRRATGTGRTRPGSWGGRPGRVAGRRARGRAR